MELLIANLFTNPFAFAAFLVSIVIGLTFHEFAHAWMANRLGDLTPKYAGRLTLNPSRHFDPTGLIVLLLLGFGWGKPVPINTRALKGRWDELKVALAGPGSNLVIVAICAAITTLGIKLGYSYETEPILAFFRIIMEINAVLAVFNFIPLFPLDGSAILRGILPAHKEHWIDTIDRNSLYILLGLMALEYIARIPILSTIVMIGVRIVSYLFYVFFDLLFEPIKMLFQ